MEVYENKAVVLRLQHPEKVTTLLPDSKLLKDGRLAVRWGVEDVAQQPCFRRLPYRFSY